MPPFPHKERGKTTPYRQVRHMEQEVADSMTFEDQPTTGSDQVACTTFTINGYAQVTGSCPSVSTMRISTLGSFISREISSTWAVGQKNPRLCVARRCNYKPLIAIITYYKLLITINHHCQPPLVTTNHPSSMIKLQQSTTSHYQQPLFTNHSELRTSPDQPPTPKT